MPSTRAALLVTAVALCAAFCAGCNNGPRPNQQFVQQARRLHQEGLAPAVVRQTDLTEYVQLIGERLVRGARSAAPDKTRDPMFGRMRFHLVNVTTPNVFTTGGEHVYVYTGLVRLCATEEELAAAMAHAVAHAVNLDVQALGVRPDPNLPPAGIVWQFVTNRFTARQEWEADKLAFAAYARAGWDPDRFGALWTRLADLPAWNVPAAVDRAPLAIRPEAARVSGVEPQRRWRKPPEADRQTYEDLRRQAEAMARTAPMQQPAQVFLRACPNCVLPADRPEQVEAQEQLRPPPVDEVPIEPS